MTTERRAKQARQRVLQTDGPLGTALRYDAYWALFGERAF